MSNSNNSSANIIKDLNPQQKKAVKHLEGPLLVLAGAGSGKTRVLTRRIAYMIHQYRVSPYNILAVTFTNKAANEMQERVAELVGGLGQQMWVSTFHSFCVRILRREIAKIGYDRNFVIYDTTDQKSLMKNVLKELNVDIKKTKPAAVLSEISNAKNELISPEEYSYKMGNLFTNISGQAYELYQKKLKDNNALDFDDLIMKTVELFREYPLVLEHYQDRFQYISVDEYQDVNTAQYKLVQLLADKYKNICVVGDPDQGIYGFRGADIRNILNFEKDYPQSMVIKLEQNYRSKEKILDAAHSVIANNLSRKEKKLWTDLGEGSDLELYIAFDEKDEANYICREINKLIEKGYRYQDIAVLYRTNAQSRALENSLVKYAIPYQIVGGVRFYDRMEIKDIIAYLRVIYNRADDISFLRIINRPRRGIGDGTTAKLQAYADKMGISLYDAALAAEKIAPLTKVYTTRVQKFINMMEEFRQYSREHTITRLTEKILKDSGYKQNLQEEGTIKAQSRMENIEELFSVMSEFETDSEEDFENIEVRVGQNDSEQTAADEVEIAGEARAAEANLENNEPVGQNEAQQVESAVGSRGTLTGFLEEVSLIADVDNMDESSDHITLMTLHSAKGLEFPVVFLAGMEEGIFPHSNSMFEEEGLEEERRLCYVGITRAKERLYFTRARERMRFGQHQSNPPSQFLKEIPGELFTIDDSLETDADFDNDRIKIDNDKIDSMQVNSSGTPSKRSGADEEGGSKDGNNSRRDKANKRQRSTPSRSSKKYKVGQKVVHPKWGIGTITEINNEKSLEIKIKFDRGKARKLLAEYAPIQKV